MKTILRSYRFSLSPTKQQARLLNKHFGCVRFVYNKFLSDRIEKYKQSKTSISYYEQAADLTTLKKETSTTWLKEVNSQSLQFSLRCLDSAYKNFFSKRTPFPRFKSKRAKNSFTVPQFVQVVDGKLHIPKFSTGIKLILHRPLVGKIRHCTLSKTPTGKYFVSILCETMYLAKAKTGKECGLDLGIKDLAISSEWVKFVNHRYLKRYEQQLKQHQRHLSRKVKGSKRYENQRLQVAYLHEKVANTRLDRLHQVTTQLINNYDYIALEDLHVKGMIRNRKLAKHIADVSWGTFVNLLTYKAAWNDRELHKIDRFYPSSKSCSCGWIKEDLKLSDRVWTCPVCNLTHDRDILAANNILEASKKHIGAELSDYTLGGSNKTSVKKHKPMKSEAHSVFS